MLENDEDHRHEDHNEGRRKVFPLMDVVAVDAHELRQGEGCGELRKLCRLQAQRS